MKQPLISIAIPVYNNEKTIQKTIDSCLSQDTEILYEILIVDDASEDTTPQILSKYQDEKIRVITLKERVPLIANHNKCLENALGDYVLFCHADDFLKPLAIEILSQKIKQRNYPTKYVLWGHSMFRDYSLQLEKAAFKKNEIIKGIDASLLPMHGGLTPSGTCYSRESLLSLGGFMHVDIMTAPSDITTMLHMALNDFRFEMMDEMIFIRKDASTLTSDTKANTFLEAYDNAYKYFIEETSTENIFKLLDLSLLSKQRPYYFYYAIAQEKMFTVKIRNILIKKLLTSPWEFKRKIVRKILSRVL